MHLLLIGASGRTGSLVLSHALSQNHTVTALVRDPSVLTPHRSLQIVKGTPSSPEDVSTAFNTSMFPIDAVIVTLISRRASDSPFAKPTAAPRFMADAVGNIRTAMKSHNVSRLVVMSAAGTTDSMPSVNFFMRAVMRYSNMRFQYEDHDALDRETRADKGIEWTLVRPVMLTEGMVGKVRDLGDRGERASWWPSVPRESVARFLVDCAVDSEGSWVGRTPVIAS